MPFQNNVVAGTTLVRDAIKSPNYVAGVSGWSINKVGSAEFNDITVRGSLVASNGTDSVVVTNTSNPRIQFFKSGIAEPAEIVGYRPLGTGAVGIQSATSNTATHTRMFEQLDEFGWRIGYGPTNITLFGVDTADGSMEATLSNLVATHIPLCVDGKVLAAGSATTTSASTTDVAVTSANAVNTPLLVDRAYIAFIKVALHSTVAADRAQFKLWNGGVGVGTAVGAANIKCNATASQFETVDFTVLWRAAFTEIVANMNLSVNRLSGTGTVNVLVDQNYSMVIMEIGDASNIGGL